MLRSACTVLIAEDDSRVRGELTEALRHARCTVVGSATNTDDALRRFEELLPDIVVIDITLPGTFSPFATIGRMRRRHPAVIFATGAVSQNAAMMEALSHGATDFFLKPIRRRSVNACLQRNLG